MKALAPVRDEFSKLKSPGREINDEQARRVASNLEALHDAIDTPIPAQQGDILRWHRKLLECHPGRASDTIGAFGAVQNWIGGDAFGPRYASFIPLAPEDVAPLVDDLVMFCGRTDLPPVARRNRPCPL
ncbi:MAG: hypothetical protein ACR2ME_02035 [Acidimicrobiia bacterium]